MKVKVREGVYCLPVSFHMGLCSRNQFCFLRWEGGLRALWGEGGKEWSIK